jgi:hypothetical protein
VVVEPPMGWIFDDGDCGRPVNTKKLEVVVTVTSGIMVTPEVVERSEICDVVEDEILEPDVVETGTGLGDDVVEDEMLEPDVVGTGTGLGDDVELVLAVLKLELVAELVVVLVVES